MRDNWTVWAWYCDKPQGGFLFHGNPNPQIPPYHCGGIYHMIRERMVYAVTRITLIKCYPMKEWNRIFPKCRVKPVRVTVTMECGKKQG